MKFWTERITNKRIAVFGAGYYGKMSILILREFGVEPYAVIDNDSGKVGKLFEDVPVVTFSSLIQSLEKIDIIILGTIQYADEMKTQLLNEGIKADKTLKYTDLDNAAADFFFMKYSSIFTAKKHAAYNDDKLKVLFDSQIFEEQENGGISRYFYELAKGFLKRDDCYLDIYAGLNISTMDFDILNDRHCHYYGITARNVIKDNPDLRRHINYRGCLELNREVACDIYHPTYYRETGYKNYRHMVVTVHDMIHEIFGLDEETLDGKSEKIRHADKIIAISKNTKKDLMEHFDIPEEKVSVIYHGNPLTIDAGLNRIVKDDYILYVGQRFGYKNARGILQAYSISKYRGKLKLVFFGGGAFQEEEAALAGELGIFDDLLWLGGDDEMLANLYANAEVFVYPSKYEGFGLPILEAMHYGTPVITSNTSSMPEVGGIAAEYFNPYSFESICEKLDEVLGDHEKRKRMSVLGLKREKDFSWEKCCAQTMDVYNSIV